MENKSFISYGLTELEMAQVNFSRSPLEEKHFWLRPLIRAAISENPVIANLFGHDGK